LLCPALRERLAGETRAKDVVIGYESGDLSCREGAALIVGISSCESSDVVDQPVGRKIAESARIDLSTLAVEFACHDALAA